MFFVVVAASDSYKNVIRPVDQTYLFYFYFIKQTPHAHIREAEGSKNVKELKEIITKKFVSVVLNPCKISIKVL
jgi:hypothetical protein